MTTERQSWRLFSLGLKENEAEIALSDDEHHYAHHVLRLHEGDAVEVGDTAGLVGCGLILSTDKRGTRITLSDMRRFPAVKPRIHLVVGMPKQSALDDLVALCSEIGVACLTLAVTERSQNRNPPRMERLEKIARESMRVTKSAWQMDIVHVKQMSDSLCHPAANTVAFLCDESPIYETGAPSHNHLVAKLVAMESAVEEIRLFVGPEASFSAAEREMIRSSGASPVSLGCNILRVPTAAAVAAAIAVGFVKQV